MSPADSIDEPLPFSFSDPKTQRTWELLVCPRTFGMEVAIQRLLEERALKAVQRNRALFLADEYQMQMDGWRRDVATGVYEFGGKECWHFLNCRPGWMYNAWLQLHEKCPEVTQALVERIADDPEKFKELDVKIALANDPNRGRPAADPGPSVAQTSPSPTPSPPSPGNPGARAETTSAA